MTIITKTSFYELRGMCIRHDYYTKGDNDSYSKMLRMFDDRPLSGDRIEVLAQDIKDHSVTEDTVYDIAVNILHEATHTILLED